jgi:hypothetical protein
MAGVLRPDELKSKEALRSAAQEKKAAPAGMPAFLKPPTEEAAVATPKDLAASPPAAPVVVVPVEKEDVR